MNLAPFPPNSGAFWADESIDGWIPLLQLNRNSHRVIDFNGINRVVAVVQETETYSVVC